MRTPVRAARLRLALIALLAAGLAAACAATTTPRASSTVDGSRYEAPGRFNVTVSDQVWRDATRGRDVPVRIRLPEGDGPVPLVLFSHGLGGSVEGGRLWGEHWASHGFAVIHLQHPGSDTSVWRGQEAPGEALRGAAGGAQLLARVQDVHFVLDELERRARAGDRAAARIDRQRIGVSGHSFGAVTTQAVAGQRLPAPPALSARTGPAEDPRPRAFLAFSPSARRDAERQFGAIQRPFFSVTGTEDGYVAPGLGVPPAQRREPFDAMPPGDKYLLVLDGADHMIFNGGERRRGEGRRDAEHQRLVRATTLAYWRATLLDDADARAWLRGAAGYVGGAGEFRFK